MIFPVTLCAVTNNPVIFFFFHHKVIIERAYIFKTLCVGVENNKKKRAFHTILDILVLWSFGVEEIAESESIRLVSLE